MFGTGYVAGCINDVRSCRPIIERAEARNDEIRERTADLIGENGKLRHELSEAREKLLQIEELIGEK